MVTAHSFAAISQLHKLQRLELPDSKIDNAGFSLLKPCAETLVDLGVGGCATVSDEGIKAIVATLPNLESILVAMGEIGSTSTSTCTGESLKELAKLPKLKSIGWGVNGMKTQDYALLADLPAVEQINLSGTATDEMLPAFQKCQHLRRLLLDHTAITDAGFEHLKNILPLKSVSLWNTKLTDAGLAAFKQARPVVKVEP